MPRAPAPVPSEPAVFWVGGSGEGQSYAGPEPGSAAPGPMGSFPHLERGSPPASISRRPGPRGALRAPPAPPGKMAPAEQLRHQPWRRARPTAILAPSSRSPPPHRKIPHSGRLGGRERHWARALSAKISATRVCLLFGPAGRTGPAGDDAWLGGGSSARREDSSRPGRGSPAVLPRQAARRRGRGSPAGRHAPRTGPGRAGSRPRALPSAARPRSPRRGRPPKRREGGNQDETETRSPPPPPSPP